MSDISWTAAPKTDQLNSDDLIGGPITAPILRITVKPKPPPGEPPPEQPMSIFLPDRKPYKPCKSMIRVLILCWGPDCDEWIGRSLTLFREPSAVYSGRVVGGIRISHLTHIDAERTLSLTDKRGSKSIWKVKPLVVSDPLADALREIGATIEQADQWCADNNRPPLSTADANTRAKAANHFRNNPGLLVQKAASAGEEVTRG